MRTFTLVMGTFNLEFEQMNGTKVYSVKCNKVGFSRENHFSIESLLFPFCEYLKKKQLKHQLSPSRLVYKGFTLELEHYSPSRGVTSGVCRELEFEDNHYLDELIDTFLDKVDEYLEKTMKARFTVVYEGFTLEVQKYNVFGGDCEAIRFVWGGFKTLDELVSKFQEKVDEHLKLTEIEYRGHKLEVSLSKEIENKFEGCSDICDGWTTLQSTKEEVIKTFKVRVDAIIQLNIQSLESAVMEKQDELEEYLRTQGYMFDSIYVPFPKLSFLYAIHPDYWDRWVSGTEHFPEGKVVFIRQVEK